MMRKTAREGPEENYSRKRKKWEGKPGEHCPVTEDLPLS